MSVWLDTERARPGWVAVLHLLADGDWHPITDAQDALAEVANLAPTTVRHHMQSASTRGWIVQSHGQVRLGPTPPEHLMGARQ